MPPFLRNRIPLRAADGRVVAHLMLAPADDDSPISAPAPDIALRENARYEYEFDRPNLHLQCSLARASRIAGPTERGLIETGAHCGLLRLDAVDPRGNLVGNAWADVRSFKLGEPEHYRAMLGAIGARLTGLLYDARASSQIPLSPAWRDEPRALQQRVEFLRATLEDPAFHAALRHILANPHRRLQPETGVQPIGKPARRTAALARAFVAAPERVPVPAGHPLGQRLRARGVALPSAPARVTVARAIDDFDIPENQFVRHALATFRGFLDRAADVLAAHGREWWAVAERARRGARDLDRQLAHAFFHDLSPLRHMPLDSPALQRRAGYRQVLQAYLAFDANARLTWKASDEVFHAGQRDTARLYEYWLFFQLLDWFCGRFAGARAEARALVRHEAGRVALALRHGTVAGPFEGEFADRGRNLRAQFSYNRTFAPSAAEAQPGSWTRAMRPDFTLTIWPAEMSLDLAEARDTAVHLHFDAKYRVDDLQDALEGVAEADPADVMKMHAYRDAIRRSAGAYVLHPGADAAATHYELMRRADGIVPSLGAFAITPDSAGQASGFAHLRAFLDEVIAHLAAQSLMCRDR